MRRVSATGRQAVGELIRDWRTRRKYSQLDVSSEMGVSTRHLSFVETGRSRPSPELILTLADFNRVGVTVVVATHDRELIRLVRRRTITLDAGRVVEVA